MRSSYSAKSKNRVSLRRERGFFVDFHDTTQPEFGTAPFASKGYGQELGWGTLRLNYTNTGSITRPRATGIGRPCMS